MARTVSPKNPVPVCADRGALLILAGKIEVFGLRNGYPAGCEAAQVRLKMAFWAKREATVHRNLLLAKAEFARAVANVDPFI